MAVKFSFFKAPKHRTFNYRPRIWDPEKEEQLDRWKKAEERAGILIEKEDKDKPYRPNIKGQFRKTWEENNKKKVTTYSKNLSTIIVLVTAVVLFLAIYYAAKLFPYLFQTN